MGRTYLIWAPPLCGNAGVRGLYKLAVALRNHGQRVRLWSWGETRQLDFAYVGYITPQMREEDIVIYPETVSGNPLQIRNVVRWVLFFPGHLGGDTHYHPSEKIFTWCDAYYPGAPRLLPDVIDHTIFYDAGLPRTRDCTFVHKDGKWKKLPELNGLTEITMQWPATREELAYLLQTSNTVYSWDSHSSLLDEAYFCGASVKIIEEDGFRDFKLELPFSQEVFEQELHFFITETQTMHYQGELQPLSKDILRKRQAVKRKLRLWHMLQKVYPGRFTARKMMHYLHRLRQLGESSIEFNEASN